MWQMLVRMIEANFAMVFETIVLLVIYVVGAIFIAKYGDSMLLVAWMSGGVAVGALVRAFQSGGSNGGKKEG